MQPLRRDRLLLALLIALGSAGVSRAQTATPKQPKVAPGPNEPDWAVILKEGYGLSMFDDLRQPDRLDRRGHARAVSQGGRPAPSGSLR